MLKQLAHATGGEFFQPETIREVVPLCAQIARDIRNQYTIAYTPQTPRRMVPSAQFKFAPNLRATTVSSSARVPDITLPARARNPRIRSSRRYLPRQRSEFWDAKMTVRFAVSQFIPFAFANASAPEIAVGTDIARTGRHQITSAAPDGFSVGSLHFYHFSWESPRSAIAAT